ncbi:MAG TPA: class I SAM-dependent methyltransferase [Candidatus Binatia bacterium]|nr:class I SAM-dependent methyltransferase [Candidatus Binatia bacterium]
MHSYMFDQASTAEYERLDLMSKILDPWTQASLLALGVHEGWSCLELGGGNGSITQWLCEQVGASGSVTSVDINPQLIELVDAPNLTVRQADLRTADLPRDAFDLVMCRAMLHQIADYAQTVLEKMAAALKPGGWLFVCEPDFHLALACEPKAWRDAWNGIIAWGKSQGVEWFIGRRLPAMVQALGLGHPDAKTEVPNIRGTTRDAVYFQLFFETVRERVISAGFVDAKTLDAANVLLSDPNCWTQCWMLTSVWVRKPL